jgi:hypothetical protein
MRYIDAIKGLGLTIIVVSLLNYAIPKIELNVNIELLITITTFLFAILAGFFISRLNNRYDRIRGLTSSEDALLLSFFNASKIYGNKFSEEIKEIIDKYYINCYDHPVSGAYRQTAPQVQKLWDKMKEIGKHKSDSLYQLLCQSLVDLEKARKESSATYNERMSFGQWLVLILLSAIIITGLFLIRTGTLTSSIITVLLTASIILVLLITRDLNNFMLGGSPLMEESGQEVLDAIGKERYYHEYFIKKGISHPHKNQNIKKYRLGTHKINSGEYIIRVVEK